MAWRAMTSGVRLSPLTVGRVAGMVLICGLAAGCDGESQATRAVREAKQELAAITGGVSASVDPHAEARFRAIADSLRSVEGEPSTVAAAAALESRAQLGLGQLAALGYEQQSRSLAHGLTQVRSHIGGWARASARAASVEGFDAGPELDALGRQIAVLEEEAVGARATAEDLAGTLAELNRQADLVRAEARDLRTQAAEVRLRMGEVSATDGVALAERTRELSRRADALEGEAGSFDAAASVVRPELAEARLRVQRVQNQLRLLGEARQRVVDRSAQARAEASEARADAQDQSRLLEAALASSSELNSGVLEEAFESARSAMDAAVTAAGRARSGDRTNAALALARAQRGLGDLWWARARDHASLADAFEQAAGVEPRLMQADSFTERARASRASESEALQMAGEAYLAAKDAYASSGARGPAAAELERVQNALEQLSRATAGAVLDLDALLAPPPAPADDGSWTDDASGDAGSSDAAESVRAKIAAVVSAAQSGTPIDLGGLVYTGDPRLDAMLAGLGRVIEANGAYDRAFTDRFGMSTGEFASQSGQGAGAGVDISALESFDPSVIEISIDGDVGTASLPGAMSSSPDDTVVPLINDGGEWKLDISGFLADAPVDQILAAEPAIDRILAALDEARAEVEAGQYDDAQTAWNALMLRLQPIIFEVMGAVLQGPP